MFPGLDSPWPSTSRGKHPVNRVNAVFLSLFQSAIRACLAPDFRIDAKYTPESFTLKLFGVFSIPVRR